MFNLYFMTFPNETHFIQFLIKFSTMIHMFYLNELLVIILSVLSPQ